MDDFQGMIDSIVGVATGQQTTVRNLCLSLLCCMVLREEHHVLL